MSSAPPSQDPLSDLRFVPMTAEYARAVLAWRYEPPYDLYNADPGDAEEDLRGTLLNPDYRYHAVLDGRGDLVAFRCFGEDARVPGGDYSADALDMGGGLRPDLTGQGLGPPLLRAAMDFARLHFAPRAFRATVAAWNLRAQRACARAGYRPVSTFQTPQGREFVIMVCPAGEKATR